MGFLEEVTFQKAASVQLRLANATDGTEAFLEFVDAAFCIHKLRKTSKERVRVRCDADGDEAVLHAIDHFLLFRSFGGAADKAFTSRHIYEDDWIVFRMKVLFHENLEARRVSDAAGRGRWQKSWGCQASKFLST